jgi:glycosyltransferase involved in cell wall biosynthesis
MRIVHVVQVGGDPTSIQGDQRHAFYLARAQRARGHDVAAVTYCTGLFSKMCEEEGVPVFIMDSLDDGAPPSGGGLPAGEQLAVKLREFGAEVIHCHELNAAKTVVAVANSMRLPCVITLHGGIGMLASRFIEAKRSGMKFAIIAVCKNDLALMRETGMAGIDFHYVPNGTREFSGMRQQERDESRRPNLILVGSLGFRKGIDIAILAMVELRRRRGSDCPVLNIYGKGKFGDYFSEMVRVLHLDDVVKFHGIEMDILDRCASSDVLVVPSRAETGPLVVIEAMSRGMPIVATSVGEVNDMLPGPQYGRVVPENSITAFADGMDLILTDVATGQFNPDLLVKRHQSEYSVEKMVDRIEAIYQSAALSW